MRGSFAMIRSTAYALFDYRCIPGDEGIVVQLA
jgi:hypothetical protein